MNHRLIQHFLHPKGLFQVVGLLACCALFVAHLGDTAPSGQEALPLTVSNQRLLDPLIPEALIARLSPTLRAALPFGVFAAALLVLSARGQRRFAAKVPLLTVQMFIGLFFNNDLLLLLATQLPIVLPRKQALLWLLAQSVGMLLVWHFVLFQALGWLPSVGATLLVTDSVAYPPELLQRRIWGSLLLFMAWQAFCFGLGHVAMAERRQRDRLRVSHAELRATQQLLAESVRAAERKRMARDLHDALGHHLTAINLHLDLALRHASMAQAAPAVPSPALESLRTVRALAQQLLSELRSTVSRERSVLPIDLERSLRTLCDGLPMLDVQLKMDVAPGAISSSTAHIVFRCAQEALSNVCRHAQASAVRINVGVAEDTVWMEVCDDGIARRLPQEGNGLRGMRERLSEAGGCLCMAIARPSGLSLRVELPVGPARDEGEAGLSLEPLSAATTQPDAHSSAEHS